ncbi:GNAT family N-acetyltransferase [Pacificimonas flava]|uniref:Acetyltransferase (GNAT) family n=1 Tax=Pacificimonas flava TaxID=1234595 RepID=M2U3I5_9SPHN|nr:GNAT family N-acetyltransferase [Pacificimonas flava]EMD82587.1 Acetyltransferase (GNAT) family [Pacificimonas flava]MBB5281415.1 GNAT superfamily N-acetyltransferase [Pacificimonas flava]
MTAHVRLARPDEVIACQDVERRAAAVFASTPYPHLVDAPPTDACVLRAAIAEGLQWIGIDSRDETRLAGQLTAAVDADSMLIAQVDVVPHAQRQGLGRALIGAAEAEARRRGLSSLWLRTFRDIPWNAPFYASLGFQPEAATENDVGEHGVAQERDLGLNPATRVTMRKLLV